MKNFEFSLPSSYSLSLSLDAGKKQFSVKINKLAGVIAVVGVIWGFIWFTPFAYKDSFRALDYFIFLAALLIYIPLHELAHGGAYKLLTRQKLTFGFKRTVAFCGVPNIYVYRKTALISLLTPFVLFTLVFGLGCAFTDGILRFFMWILLSCHVSGCAGDLYDTYILLFRLKSPLTLMRDTGPMQEFYAKAE